MAFALRYHRVSKHRMKTVCLVLMLLGPALLGCSKKKAEQWNVILISVDTLRADRLGCYGYKRPTSPFLDDFAASGTLFENAVAQSPWTLPSHAALLTGRFPHRIGVVDEWKRLPSDAPTLASILKEKGFFTGSFVNSYWVSELFGFDKGFETTRFFDDTMGNLGGEITDAAVAWLNRHGRKPFFLFIHYYDVHSDYAPDDSFRELLAGEYDGNALGTTEELLAVREGKVSYSEKSLAHVSNLYDAEIRQLDGELGRLFKHIRDSGLEATTVVVVTSDHGEEFMDHGGVLHGRTMYREVLQVPLLIRGPKIPKNRRVEELAMLIDVVPTVLGCLGIDVLEAFDGVDLVKMLRAPSPEHKDRLALASADHNNEKPDILRMMQNLRYKFCLNQLSNDRELYDLRTDPLERTNIAEDKPDLVEQFMQILDRVMAQKGEGAQAPPRTEEEMQRLKELGY